jgi:ankyrin repeat protein
MEAAGLRAPAPLCALVALAVLLAACAQKSLEEQLILAVRQNHPAEVDRLLAAGANVNADKVKGFEGRPPLFHAATYGYVDIARKLVEKGANVNAGVQSRAVTPLMVAALNGSAAMVALLIQFGADVNAREAITGSAALTEAVRKGDAEVLVLLLNAGADPNVPMGDGRVPLCYARAMGHKQAEQVLSAAGAQGNC